MIRLESGIDKSGGPDACWPWIRGRNAKGYGQVWACNKNWKTHRLAYAVDKGVLDNQLVLHTCDNPPCCNPMHLVLGTNADNAHDKVMKNRQAKGVDFSSTKLNASQVQAIRAMTLNHGSRRCVAASFGITSSQLYNIRTGKAWKHVPATTEQ